MPTFYQTAGTCSSLMRGNPRWQVVAVLDERWSVPPRRLRLSVPSEAGAALALDSVAKLAVFGVGSTINRQMGVDLHTGEALWHAELPLEPPLPAHERIDAWGGGRLMAVCQQEVALLTREGPKYVARVSEGCFTRPRLHEDGRLEGPLPAPVLSDDGRILAHLTNDRLTASDVEGRPVWELPFSQGQPSSLIPAGADRFACIHEGDLMLVDAGRIVARRELDLPARTSIHGRVGATSFVLFVVLEPLLVDATTRAAPVRLPSGFPCRPLGEAGPLLFADQDGRYAALDSKGLVASLRRPWPYLRRFPPAAPGQWIVWADRETNTLVASDTRGRISWSLGIGPTSVESLVAGTGHILAQDRTLLVFGGAEAR